MIPLDEFRALLGPTAASFTHAEVERIRACEYAWADAIFNWWLNKQKRALGELPEQTKPQ